MTEVKICGLTRADDVDAARAADYLGFVVATGTRRSLRPSEAQDLMFLTDLPTVAVTTSSDAVFIAHLASKLRPHAVQLSGPVDRRLLGKVRSRVRCEVWAAMHVGATMPHLDLAALTLVDRVVIDTAGGPGGTGTLHDHRISAVLVRELGPKAALAGGLTPENVAGAIAQVSPAMVDVSSGVETFGRKDPAKVDRFIRAVRECR